MGYTVSQLAKLSGVTVRTLHWYDQMGLLKPTYHGSNGYRYYEEKELLLLQQILFFRELGFELKRIKQILGHSDFDLLAALSSHRQILEKNLARTKKLLKTIDKTIKHLKGKQKMEEKDLYLGFTKKQQAEYEKQLIDRFGQEAKDHIAESKERIKDWTKSDFEKAKANAEGFMKELTT
ncbi:MAG: MerR family transcriptional regulator, partial [Chlamydiia bacterium]|nr:MerR family transcriptional regulator [Chlamydiia bacterium]